MELRPCRSAYCISSTRASRPWGWRRRSCAVRVRQAGVGMQDRQGHKEGVRLFLKEKFRDGPWELTLPIGTGNETYFARCDERDLFVKLGVQAGRYQAVAAPGITLPVLAAGALADGTSIIVQPHIPGKRPARSDYRLHLEQFASTIRRLHHSPEVKQLLPEVRSDFIVRRDRMCWRTSVEDGNSTVRRCRRWRALWTEPRFSSRAGDGFQGLGSGRLAQ